MIKTLVIAALVAGSSIAHAEDWRLITDAVTGGRLMVDIDTFKLDRYNKSDSVKGNRASVKMSFIEDNHELVFLSIIDVDDCINKKQGTLVTKFAESGNRTNKYWMSTGTKVYDYQGAYLCGMVHGYLGIEMDSKKPKGPAALKQKIKM